MKLSSLKKPKHPPESLVPCTALPAELARLAALGWRVSGMDVVRKGTRTDYFLHKWKPELPS